MGRSKIAVIGLGNYLLCDEGAGLHTIDLLRNKKFSKNVDLVDAGTPGMNLLHQFEDRKKIIFVDSGNCGLNPGEFIRFRPDEVKSRKTRKNYSLHEFDLISFLESARSLGKIDETDIIIYCIQIDKIEMSQEPSEKIKKTLPLLSEQIYFEIENGGIAHA